MKVIDSGTICQRVKEACITMSIHMDEGIKRSLTQALDQEASPLGREILKDLLENEAIARTEGIPLCQDTGMIVAFVSLGQGVQIQGDSLEAAIQQGVREGYQEGYLRKSVVACPLRRENTKDNTPAVIHYQVVPGDELVIRLAAKGFGSENMSRTKMLKPVEGVQGVKAFVLETIEMAGGNPCPPIVVGVGIGGTLEKAALLSKEALLRELGTPHPDPYLAQLEAELLDKINGLGIGPQGFGGTTTALAVHVETFPTHIAGLPVAVNINCHASRHGEIRL